MGHGDTWAAVSGPALVDGDSLLPGGAEGSWVGGGACRAWHCLYSIQTRLVQGSYTAISYAEPKQYSIG